MIIDSLEPQGGSKNKDRAPTKAQMEAWSIELVTIVDRLFYLTDML